MFKMDKNKAVGALKREILKLRAKRELNNRMSPNHMGVAKRAKITAGNKLKKAVSTMKAKQELKRRMVNKTGPVKRAVLGKVVYPTMDQMKKLRGK
jgi:hypothetical protein